jgi:hypothetical protein
MTTYHNIIKLLAKSPDTQLDKRGAELCSCFDGTDEVRFLRDLLDLCVRYAWASSLVVATLEAALSSEPPETDDDAAARRAELVRRWET